MRNIRNSIVVLIILLAFFYNVERLDVGIRNIINIQSYVYILVTLAILSIITFPSLTKYGFLKGFGAWIVIYLLVKLTFYPQKLLIAETGNIYLAIVELSFLMSALYLSYQVAKYVYDIEKTLNSMMFFGAKDEVMELQNADEIIRSELYKGRRFDVPLSLLTIEIDKKSVSLLLSKTIEEIQERLVKRYGIIQLTKVLGKHLRRSDTMMVDLENQRLCVLSFGSKKEDIGLIAKKLKEISEIELGVNVLVGGATFPDEVRTFDGLLELSVRNIDRTN